MKLKSEYLRLYAVTDRQWLKDKTLARAVEEAILGGVTFVQLREKRADFSEFKKIALEVKAVTDKYGIPFVINDNVELCKEIDADGVHVGAEDMSVKKAREILGPNKIIGGTARTLESAVFDTNTKSGTTHMSKETAQAINNAVNIPTVAIGGINAGNITALKDYGISGVAVVSAIFACENIGKAAMILRSSVDSMI